MRAQVTLLVWFMLLKIGAGSNPVERHKNEELAAGTEVADLPQIFGLTWNERKSRTFKLLSQKLVTREPESVKTDEAWVNLDSDTGKITLAKRNDREKMCGSALKCIVEMQVVMLPQHYFTLLNIELFIVDTNDHSPKFSAHKMQVNISEDVAKNDVIDIDYLQAIDLDIGKNSELSYKITPNDFFDVDQIVDEAGRNHLQLVVKADLDHESLSSQRLRLTAIDGGSPSRSSEVDVIINILDENDNAPVFDLQEYECDLKESVQAGTVILTVHASDKDSEDFGEVRYYLSNPVIADKASTLARHLLDVNLITGDVVLKQKPERSEHDGLKVLVEARDMDLDKPKIGKTWIKLHVEDVNDNDPIISVNFIVEAENNTAYVLESESRGVYIAYASATDADNGRNGEVELFLRTSFANGVAVDVNQDMLEPYFVLGRGLIEIGKRLDREKQSSFIVTVTACDHGELKRCSELDIKIIVLDVNDFAPKFSSDGKTINLLENSEFGIVVDKLTAIDNDQQNQPGKILDHDGNLIDSNYGKVYYSIVKGDKSYFEINAETGELSLLKPLDYEKSDQWELIVNAKDGGVKLARSSNYTVHVNVIDTNDNPPVFVNPARNETKVYATTLKDQLVIKIKAKDSDIGDNSKLIYEIIEEDGTKIAQFKKQRSIFLLHPTNGDLRLNFSNPNISDTLGSHKLVIQVADSGISPLKRTTKLIIEVTDSNVAVPVAYGEIDLKVIIIIAVIGFVFIALIVIIVCAMANCQRKNKEARTYNCRNAESKASKVWITTTEDTQHLYDINTGQLIDGRMIEQNVKSSSQPSMRSGRESSRNEYSSYEKDKSHTKNNNISPNHQTSMSTFSYESKKNPGVLGLPVVTPFTVDRDSGRGDSDPEMTNHETVDISGQEDNNKSTVSSDLAPRCSSACLQHGHSDSCWMPSPTKQLNNIEDPQLSYSRTSMDNSINQNNFGYPMYRQPYISPPNQCYQEYSDDFPDYPPPPSIHDNPYQTQYHHNNYNNELVPISESCDINFSPVPRYDVNEGDDVSVHTQLALSTDVTLSSCYNGSQSGLNVVPLMQNDMTGSLRRKDHEPPAVQRTSSNVYKQPNYLRAGSRLSSCSSNNSTQYRPRNIPHRNNPYNNMQLPPYSPNNNSNYSNNIPESSTLPRLHHDNSFASKRKFASTDHLITPAPATSGLDEYYNTSSVDEKGNDGCGQVSMKETQDILKSIEQLLEP